MIFKRDKMDYSGAVFFDYDGTLTDEALGIYKPTNATVSAIKKLQQKGFFVCLATGRAKCYAPKNGIEFDGYITSNGAYAELCGKTVKSIAFPQDLLSEVIDYFVKNDIYYSVETQKRCYARDLNEKSFRSMIDNFNIPADVFDPMDEISEIERSNIAKMLFAYPDEDTFFNVKKHFNGKLKLDKHRFSSSADVGLYGITKGIGVSALLKALDVPFENTYAFGDGTNDIEMMREVKHSVAMGICAPELREISETITESVENEGISKALEKYGLI
jgi:Cof subfamily protein (haloacid dehalogenase superfamily)